MRYIARVPKPCIMALQKCMLHFLPPRGGKTVVIMETSSESNNSDTARTGHRFQMIVFCWLGTCSMKESNRNVSNSKDANMSQNKLGHAHAENQLSQPHTCPNQYHQRKHMKSSHARYLSASCCCTSLLLNK